MTPVRIATTLITLAMPLLLAGCATTNVDPGTEELEAFTTTTQDGSRIYETADASLRIEIPQGVSTEEEVSAEVFDPNNLPEELEEAGISGTVYDLLPSGSQFSEPVTVTRRIRLEDFGWQPSQGVPMVVLAVKNDQEGEWDYLRDQSSRIDGDFVIVRGTTTHFSPLIAIGFPAQVSITDAAADIGVEPQDEIPTPTSSDIRVFGTTSMYDAIVDGWEQQLENDVLQIVNNSSRPTPVDEELYEVTVEEFNNAVDNQQDSDIDDEFAIVPGDVFFQRLIPTFNGRIFEAAIKTGDLDAWTYDASNPNAAVSCRIGNTVETSVLVDVGGVLAPLLISLSDSALPGLENDVPVLNVELPYSVTCAEGTAVQPITGDPTVSSVCARWQPGSGGRINLSLTMDIEGIGEAPQQARTRLTLEFNNSRRARPVRYDNDADVWVATFTLNAAGTYIPQALTVSTEEGGTFDVLADLRTKLPEIVVTESAGEAGTDGADC